jgi:hypothetical protein
LILHLFKVSITNLDLCTDELSKRITSLDERVGFRHVFRYSANILLSKVPLKIKGHISPFKRIVDKIDLRSKRTSITPSLTRLLVFARP